MKKAHKMTERPFWNPYLAGVALGLVLLSAFLLTGRGLGASGAANRMAVTAVNAVAPGHVDRTPQMAKLKGGSSHMIHNWLVFMVLGVFLGGSVAAYSAGRLKRRLIKGPRISSRGRLILALTGGILMGIAARLALGCTSG